MKVWFYCGLILFTFIHTSAIAQSQAEQQDVAYQAADGAVKEEQTQNQTSSLSPLIDLGDEYTNSIELLRNRFRVDFNVEEVTMIFFREYGSAPVVLVRPDGSKLFQGRVDEEKVEWYDDDTFDMIKIKNPVPGPWQAVGQILKDSRVMVLSDVELHAEPLPSLLFAGEILKSTAYLTNAGELIQNKQFRDVVDLDIEFISSNNPNYSNFGASDQDIATFQDNGRGMDERPGDGVFTGQFNLKVAPGEWKPIFTVKTPMYTRVQEGGLIILHENPIKIDVVQNGGEGYHKILIDVDRDLVDIESLLVDGKVRYPNTDMQNFSLTEGGSEAREHLIAAYEPGVFRVKLTAYGTTVDGRDFILDVPEYSFLAEGPEEPVVEDPLIDGKDPIVDGSAPMTMLGEDAAEKSDIEDLEETMDDSQLMFIILVVNGSIVLLGVIVAVTIVIVRRRKNKPKPSNNNASQKAKPVTTDANLTMDAQPKGLKKLFASFKRKKKDE